MRLGVLCFLLSLSIAACAPVGYHYDGFTLTPNDPCRLNEANETTSPQALSILNATVGSPKGVPRAVASMSDGSSSIRDDRFKTVEVELPAHGASSQWCQVTLRFTDGTTESGVLQLTDPGNNAPLQMAWLSDDDIDKATEESLNASRQARAKQNRTCDLTSNLSDLGLETCWFPKPALLQEVDDNRGIVYQWQPYDKKRILQLVTEQVCWDAISNEVRNLELPNHNPDIADHILSSILTDYDNATTPNSGSGPWGPYSSGYFQNIARDSVLSIVNDTARDALSSVADSSGEAVAPHLVTVQDVVNSINDCAQRHSKFITY